MQRRLRKEAIKVSSPYRTYYKSPGKEDRVPLQMNLNSQSKFSDVTKSQLPKDKGFNSSEGLSGIAYEENVKTKSSAAGLNAPGVRSREATLKAKMDGYKEQIKSNKNKLEEIKKAKLAGSPLKKTQVIFVPLKKTVSDSPNKNNWQQNREEDSIINDYSELFKKQSQSHLQFLRQEDKTNKKRNESQQSILTLTFNSRRQTFQIVRFIDQGSYGKVFLARHIFTNFFLCIKTIQKTILNEISFKRLIEQIRIQSFLSHPNILNLYGYTSDAQNIYMLLQPCLGSNIYNKLSVEPIKQKQVKKYIKEICSAIEYIHKKDIIHRDIKAENILLHENTIKICDFGWTVFAPTLRNTQCGTPIYTPPEIVKHQYYDKKVDIWCLGVLTYEMLYGASPFEVRNYYDLAKIVEEQVFFSKTAKVTEEAKYFISKCLQKSPAKRYNIRQAIEDDFLLKKIEEYRHTLG